MSSLAAIGSLRKNTLSVLANRQVTWEWTLRVAVAPPGVEHHGRADSLEGAKEQIEKNWYALLGAGNLRDRYRG